MHNTSNTTITTTSTTTATILLLTLSGDNALSGLSPAEQQTFKTNLKELKWLPAIPLDPGFEPSACTALTADGQFMTATKLALAQLIEYQRQRGKTPEITVYQEKNFKETYLSGMLYCPQEELYITQWTSMWAIGTFAASSVDALATSLVRHKHASSILAGHTIVKPGDAQFAHRFGMALLKSGSPQSALTQHEKGLAINQQTCGEAHIETAFSYGHISAYYVNTNNPAKAWEYASKALKTCHKL